MTSASENNVQDLRNDYPTLSLEMKELQSQGFSVCFAGTEKTGYSLKPYHTG